MTGSETGTLLAERWRRVRAPASRNLLRELIRATVRVNDHNSILGALWGLLGPAAMLGVLYAIFHSRFGAGLDAYPLFLLVGVVAVGFFLTGTRYLMAVLQANRSFMIDSTASREVVILSNLAPHVYKLGVELVLCAAVAAYYDMLSWKLLLLPVIVASYVAFVLGVGLVLALAFVFANDVEHLWVLISRVLYFATPVFYRLDDLSPLAAGLVYWLNPITPFLIALRWPFLASAEPSPAMVLHALVLGPLFLACGYSLFLRFESAAIERV